MKQQVFVIHGGTAFDTYEEYLQYLTQKEVSLEKLQAKDWKANLQNELGEMFEVFLVKMPNAQNAVYQEWKVWFEKYLPLLNDGVILIGHSLGAVFLAKYLSENKIIRKITATLLVAPPYNNDDGRPLPQFSITSSLLLLEQQGGDVIFFHSKDDLVVAFTELLEYQRALPSAQVRIFEDRGHFNMAEFPEMIKEIRNIVENIHKNL
jgi:predicted alpha/beta hydrolase family esterase